MQESTFQEHYDAQNAHYHTYLPFVCVIPFVAFCFDIPRYTAVVMLLSRFNVEMKQSARTRMLAAAWARHDYVLAKYLLEQEENFNLPQVHTYHILVWGYGGSDVVS